jgi:hypothetical protein
VQQTITKAPTGGAPSAGLFGGQGGLGNSQVGVPQNVSEYRATQARLTDLRRELQDAAERRNAVAERLREADEGARAGYLDRLKVLDTRIVGIETEISNSVGRLAAAPSSAVPVSAITTQRPPDPAAIAERIVDDIIPLVAIISVFVLAPFAIAISRFIWKRSLPAPKAAVVDRATHDRLEQLQQSMDAIAIEVERISEGQRFVTRVMNERGIGAGEKREAARNELR